jgi:hypothetical protein
MFMKAPRTGADEITVAEEQLEYLPLTVAVYRYPDDHPDFPGVVYLLSRWSFTPAEREQLAKGEDIYIAHIVGSGPLQPLAPQVGPGGYVIPGLDHTSG